mgnify:CR=1 FL=1
MELFTSLLTKIPNVVWSAVIASLLTFLGVLWTNKGSAKRQKFRLDHEMQKFQSEQKLSLKKAVFLEVASSFAKALGVIPKLVNLDYTEKEITELMDDHASSVAKSYLVANERTIVEILKYSTELSQVFMNLIKPRAVLLDHKKAIEIYQHTIDQANAEKNRLVSIRQEIDLQGKSNSGLIDSLSKSYEFQQNIAEKNSNSKKEQETILKSLTIDFLKICISEYSRLLSLLPPMTIAIRKELENDGESELFISAINESVKRMEASFEELLS